jgi:hypothetical protein
LEASPILDNARSAEMNTSASERLANDAFNRAEAAVASIMESIGPPTSSAAYSGVPFEPNRWSSEGVGGASSSASTIPPPLSPIGTAEMLLSAQRMQRSRVGSPPESIHTTLSGTLSARRGGLPLASRAATATQRIDDLLQAALSPDAERSSTLVRDDDDGSAFFEDGGFGGRYYEDPPVPRPVSPQRYDESSAAEQRSPDATASSSFRRGTFFGTYAGSSDAAGTLRDSGSPHAGKRRTFGDSMSAKLSNTRARTSPPRGGEKLIVARVDEHDHRGVEEAKHSGRCCQEATLPNRELIRGRKHCLDAARQRAALLHEVPIQRLGCNVELRPADWTAPIRGARKMAPQRHDREWELRRDDGSRHADWREEMQRGFAARRNLVR